MPSLENCHNIADLRRRAKSKLPRPMFDYIDGGADDEWSMRRNTAAFDELELLPSYLRNIETIDLKTEVLGTTLKLPFFSPPPACRACFITTRSWAPAEQRISRAPCTASPPWAPPAWRM